MKIDGCHVFILMFGALNIFSKCIDHLNKISGPTDLPIYLLIYLNKMVGSMYYTMTDI